MQNGGNTASATGSISTAAVRLPSQTRGSDHCARLGPLPGSRFISAKSRSPRSSRSSSSKLQLLSVSSRMWGELRANLDKQGDQRRAGEILRHAKPHCARLRGANERLLRLLRDVEYPSRIAEKSLAFLRRARVPRALTNEQHAPHRVLQALDLLADRRLREVQALRRAREAARVHDSDKRSQRSRSSAAVIRQVRSKILEEIISSQLLRQSS